MCLFMALDNNFSNAASTLRENGNYEIRQHEQLKVIVNISKNI